MTITKDGITCTGLNPHNHYTISAKVVPTPKTNINYIHDLQLAGLIMAFASLLLAIILASDLSFLKKQLIAFFVTIACIIIIAIIGPKMQPIMIIMVSLTMAEAFNYHQLNILKKST